MMTLIPPTQIANAYIASSTSKKLYESSYGITQETDMFILRDFRLSNYQITPVGVCVCVCVCVCVTQSSNNSGRISLVLPAATA